MVNRFESSKDLIQDITESGADHVGNIAQILATAVREVSKEIGDWMSDGMEMREAKKRAAADAAPTD